MSIRRISQRIAIGMLAFLLSVAGAHAAGQSPADPLVLNPTGSLALSVPTGGVWIRVSPQPSAARTHLVLETTGSLDTVATVYANLADALADLPIAEDDDSGTGFNALVRAALGFPGPYLIRVRGYFSGGSTTLSSRYEVLGVARCNWPAGCPLAEVAAHRESAGFLTTLRRVRSEILENSPPGRELASLYWRMAPSLLVAAALDGEFRRAFYDQTSALLPLAEDALRLASSGPKAELYDRPLSAAEIEQLRTLRDLVAERLPLALREELLASWILFGLEGRQDASLLATLRDSGLLAQEPARTRVVFKLRHDAAFDSVRQTIGVAQVDALVESSADARLSRIFADLPTHRAAGLGKIFLLESTEGLSLVDRLNELEEIEWAELDGKVYAFANTNDPYAANLWGLDMVGAPATWARTTGSCSVPVAVVDTGLRADLLDFAGRVLVQRGYDFADDDADPVDRHGHGTHVAGTIAAAVNNGASVAGVAPGVCIFGVKVLSDAGTGDATTVAEGIVHAANQGAKIINLSLGSDSTSQVIEDALIYAASRDVVVIAAAGNDARDGLSYPASSPQVLGVGAVDAQRHLADFSNYGQGLDLVAPGVDIVSTFHDGESCTGSGTSMAAPHVAGVAALVRSAHPTLGRNAVASRLTTQAQDLGAAGWDPVFGFGLVDASRAVGQVAAACNEALCFQNRRFVVRMTWRDFQGQTGTAKLAPLRSDSSGLLWFFSPNNWEVLVKVLDGCALNGNYWVFAAATTNVEYTLEVTDSQNGQVKRYFNPLGVAASAITDTSAFPTCGGSLDALDAPWANELAEVAPAPTPAEQGPEGPAHAVAATCNPATEICLGGNRFKVELRWRDFRNQTGSGKAVPNGTTADSALLWFFDGTNWEMLVKVLDGCGLNGRRWVFGAATTNVEYTLKITDTVTGAVKEYFNPLGRSAPAIADTGAFASCP